MKKLPKPECSLGYTDRQLEEILGDRIKEFYRWMSGQTVAICDGREYSYSQKKYIPTGEAHGSVVYTSDLENFLVGGPILD